MGTGHLQTYNSNGNKTAYLGSSSKGTGYLATYNDLELITGYFGTGPNKEGVVGLHDNKNNLGWSVSGRSEKFD